MQREREDLPVYNKALVYKKGRKILPGGKLNCVQRKTVLKQSQIC